MLTEGKMNNTTIIDLVETLDKNSHIDAVTFILHEKNIHGDQNLEIKIHKDDRKISTYISKNDLIRGKANDYIKRCIEDVIRLSYSKEYVMKKFSEELKKYIKERGWSIKFLSSKTKVPAITIYSWTSGHRIPPKYVQELFFKRMDDIR